MTAPAIRSSTAILFASTLGLAGWVSTLAAADPVLPAEPRNAQEPRADVEAAPKPVLGEEAAEDLMITLNFPENMDLKILVEYVSQQLEMNILFDERIGNKRITIKSPTQVPERSLLGLLESALRMKDLALVDGNQPGWKRIEPVLNLNQIAVPVDPAAAIKAGQAVTQIFRLEHGETKQASSVIKPFLSQPGGNSMEVPDQPILIVTDFSDNMKRISDLIRLVDQPRQKIGIEFFPLAHLDASQAVGQVTQLVASKLRTQGVAGGGSGVGTGPGAALVDISHDARTNQLIIIGSSDRVAEVRQIITSLDVPLDQVTTVYQFQVASPLRVDKLARDLIGPMDAKRLYRSAVDQEAGILIVTAPKNIHEQVAKLMRDLDVPVPVEQSRVRFYKLANATAADVLGTIRAIESGEGFADVNVGGSDTTDLPAGYNTSGVTRVDGASPGTPITDPYGRGGVARPESQTGPTRSDGTGVSVNADGTGTSASSGSTGGSGVSGGTGGIRPMRQVIRSKQATVTADTNTNSILVVADPAVQRVYEDLIKLLDRRRPQVMIEATIVTIDLAEGQSIGVEIGRSTNVNGGQLITFSSFGLSEVDAATGSLALIPGLGFNAALLNTEIADVVVRALKTSAKAKVTSSPRILVNDNATGTLSSVAEAPFASVNASDTVATTSFAGFVEAGTTITLTPHIAEGDHLNLEYDISLNAFTGAATAELPPPRQTNSVKSQVTIPDGFTIVVGGLQRSDWSKSVSSIPFLDQIPVLKHLSRSTTTNDQKSTLFIFLRPIILRDDKFEDLKYLSSRDLSAAELPADLPTSSPLTVR